MVSTPLVTWQPDHYRTFSDFNSFRRQISTFNFDGNKRMNFNLVLSIKQTELILVA